MQVEMTQRAATAAAPSRLTARLSRTYLKTV
jgi:hypothetical protein